MAAALRRLQTDSATVDWQAAVSRFRSALAKTENLAAERSEVAAAVTRISDLEQACEEASGSAEAAQARLAELAASEPSVREALAAAEEDQRALLADLGAHQLNRPVFATVTEDGKTALRSRSALSVAVAGGVRRGRNWRTWKARRRELRAACAEAELRREAAAKKSQALNASLAVAWTAVNDETAEVTRLTAEIGPLAEAVALARQRWGDHVPDGPAQAETEDAALIEWRETSAPWADEEYAASRAEVFLAALDLHKTLIAARADVFAGNLGALMDLLCADPTVASPQAGAGRGSRTWRQRTNARQQGTNARRRRLRPRRQPGRGPLQPRRTTRRPTRWRLPLRPRGSRSSWSCPWSTCRSGPSNRSLPASGRRRSAGCSPITPSGCPDGRPAASWAGWTAPSLRATPPAPGKPRVAAGAVAAVATATPATTDPRPPTAPSILTATSMTDGVVNDRRARTEPGAFNGAEDFNGASAQRIAERTARYGTWLPPATPLPVPRTVDRHPESADTRLVMVPCGSGWARRSESFAALTGPRSTCAIASPTTGCSSPTGI